MRLIIITEHNDAGLPRYCCDFSPPGGVISNRTDSDLFLPGLTVQGSDLCILLNVNSEGECFIVNKGAGIVIVMVNNSIIDPGASSPLFHGDILSIGHYKIKALDHASNTDNRCDGVNLMNINNKTNTLPESSISDDFWDKMVAEFMTSNIESDVSVVSGVNPFSRHDENERNPEDPLELFNRENEIPHYRNINTDSLFSEEGLFKQDNILQNSTPSYIATKADEFAYTDSTPESSSMYSYNSHAYMKNQEAEGILHGSIKYGRPLTFPPINDAQLNPLGIQTYSSQVPESAGNKFIPHSERLEMNNTPYPESQEAVNLGDFNEHTIGKDYSDESGYDPELLSSFFSGVGYVKFSSPPEIRRAHMYFLGKVFNVLLHESIQASSQMMIDSSGSAKGIDGSANYFYLYSSVNELLVDIFSDSLTNMDLLIDSINNIFKKQYPCNNDISSSQYSDVQHIMSELNPERLKEEAFRRKNKWPTSFVSKGKFWDLFLIQYNELSSCFNFNYEQVIADDSSESCDNMPR